MATHGHAPVEQAPKPDPAASGGKLLEYDQFIEQQLRKTRSHVRSVDIAANLMLLAAFTLGYFLLSALIDHWMVTGGLGFWGRFLLWITYITAASYWIATQIVPLLIKRINPLYAAETIERSRPTLKNTLLNFLLFRDNPAGVHQKVLYAIEEQAATNLAGFHVESAVDRTRLIRLGYVLVGILVVGAAYALFSPKDLFQTVRRVAMPWADVSPPTRTTIDEITPGDTQAFRGQRVEINARVGGLPEDGKVVIYYTTADRQIVDAAVEMSRPADGYHHVALLPAGNSVLQQTLSYRIQAGDAVTRPYTIKVVAAPTIVVGALEYEYPKYTGLLAQRVEHQGDISAIEGTRVTLEALANQDIDSAHVDFDCDNTLDLRMRVDEQTARGTFTLTLGDDRKTPKNDSYQVTFKNTADQRNPQPVRHQIRVTRDIAPEIEFVAPRKDEIDLPADAAVDLEIVAGDPDFALARVTLSTAKGQNHLMDEKLLDETWRGQWVKKYRFDPRKLGLEVGDVVDYWAVTVDNKDPNPNQTETSRRRIRIVSPSGRQGKQDQLAQNEKRENRPRQPENDDPQAGDDDHPRDGDQPPDDKSGDSKADDSQPPGENPTGGQGQDDNEQPAGDSGQGQSPDGAGGDGERPTGDGQSGSSDERQTEPGAEQSVPNDGSNDGEAIERILEHQKQDGQDSPQPEQRDEPSASDRQNQENGGQQGEQDQESPNERQQKQQSGEEPAEQKPQEDPDAQPDDAGRQQGSGANQGGEGKQSAQKQPGGKSQQQRGDGQPTQEQSGSGDQQGGEPDRANRGKPGDSASDQRGQQGGSESQEKPQRGSGTSQKQPGGSKDPQSSGEEGKGASEKQPTDDSQKPHPGDVEDRQRGEGSDPQNAERGGDGKSDKPDRPRQSTGDNNTREDGTPQDPSTQGQGANSNEDTLRDPDQKPPQKEAQQPDARGGDGENPKGQSGGGQKTEDNSGSPTPMESKPTRKSAETSPDDKEQKPEGEAQSGNTSKRESETEGEQDGEHSGGGRRGGGQKANQPGTGGAGQNTAADDGAGRSDEAGDGETSDRAGGDRQADGKTGQSGTKTGPGSSTKPSDGENEKSGGQSDPQDVSDSPSGQNAPGKGAQGGENPSDSRPGASTPQDRQWKPGVDKADEANLDYARKATDLALEHLKDQLAKDEPDSELLDKLGWTRGDLEKFVKRWEAMRQSARTPDNNGATARRELDETLRSLGLRPRATTLDSNAARDDRAQGYQEAPRTTPPAEYTESFKAYTQGTARGGK